MNENMISFTLVNLVFSNYLSVFTFMNYQLRTIFDQLNIQILLWFSCQVLIFIIGKGGLISEFFSLWLKTQKSLSNHYTHHLLFRCILIRVMICYLFSREPKCKFFGGYAVFKGQLISKCVCGVFNSSKKTNENNSTWGIVVVKLNFFVRFSEELRIAKSPFEINWPLAKIEKCHSFPCI